MAEPQNEMALEATDGHGGKGSEGKQHVDKPDTMHSKASWELSEGLVPAVLTWDKLSVTVSDLTGRTKDILQNVSGYVKPGELLGIMGSSGSGKTTLLNTLAGRLAKNATFSGEIKANGQVQELAYGASAYVSQEDVLIGVLTVYESIYFAASLRLPLSFSTAKKRALVEEVILEMGLTECAHTMIGNWHLRGVSGGQKRRVSIAMELITKPSLLFLDEPTTGLDSAAAYHVMAAVRLLAANLNRTIIAVVHQPSSEVFDQLDTLCLLSGGRTVYFGRADEAISFVEGAGLPCPPHMNIADYLLHLTNRDFDIKTPGGAAATLELGRLPSSKQSRTATIARLTDAYNREKAAELDEKIRDLAATAGPALSRAHEDTWRFSAFQAAVLTQRGALNCFRNLGVWWLRIGMYVGLMLCMGTVYFRLGYDYGDIYSRVGAIAFIAAFFPFQCIAGFPAFVDDLKIFQRERLNGYYGVLVFCVSYTFSSLPFLLLLTLLSSLLGYWLMNLNSAAEAYIYFFLMFSASMLTAESLMMTIAAVIPNFFWGIILWAGLLGIFMLVNGFFRLAGDLPAPVWRYPFHYISFVTWWYEGYMLNEFDGQTFSAKTPGSARITSHDVLDTFGIGSGGITGGRKWANFFVVIAWAVLYRVVFVVVMKVKQRLPPLKAILPLVSKLLSRGTKDASSKGVTSDTGISELASGKEVVATSVELELQQTTDKEAESEAPAGVGSPVATVLTWQKLSVFAGQETLLDDVSGYAQPGQLLAIMGASGCGKSLLLSALGDRLTPDVTVSGEIKVNGRRQRLGYGACAFVPKEDVLIGVLSVRECIQYGALVRLPRGMARASKTALVEEVISSMGLSDCADTPIGNWHMRGVSGGQRRRVSIAMELITRPSLLLLDEPTSGLDSAAAFHVLAAIRSMATRHNRTIIAVLHQPSSEVFALVNRLCLLSSGRVIFSGDPADALPVFADAGSPCPEQMNVADFFLHATNTDFAKIDQAVAESGHVAKSGELALPGDKDLADSGLENGRSSALTDHLRGAYLRSAAAAAEQAKLSELASTEGSPVDRWRESDLLFWVYQTAVLTRRSWKNMVRNIGVYWLRVVMYYALTICIGTMYFRLGTDYSSINDRALILGFITGFYGFMSIAGFPGFIEDIKVFERERLNGYYAVSAFVVSNFLSSLPIFFFIALTNGLLGYWMIGLRNTAGAFAFFVLQMFASLVAIESIMSALAVLAPNYTIGMIVGAGYLGLFILTCGYFALPAQLPAPVWRYPVYYVSVYAYLFQGFLLNEFQDITFDNISPDLPRITSKEALAIWGIADGGIFSNKWADFAMLWVWAIAYRACFVLLIRVRDAVRRYLQRRR